MATRTASRPILWTNDDRLHGPGPNGFFTRLARAGLLLEDFQRDCFGPSGLGFSDFSVLRVLQIQGPPYQMSPSRLSELVVRSTGGMTQILDRLERDGWVERSPDPADRRKVIVGLTDAGRRLVTRANKRYVRRKADLLGRLSDQEFRDIDDALRRLVGLFAEDLDHRRGGGRPT